MSLGPASLRTWGAVDLAVNAFVASVYIAAGIAGLQFTFFHPDVTSVWACSGIALAAILLRGPRVLPAIGIGAFAVNFWLTKDFGAASGVAVGNLAEAAFGWWVLSRWTSFDLKLARLRDVGALLTYGVAAGPLLAATIGPLSLCAFGRASWGAFPTISLVWWLGDGLGVLLFTPLILSWVARPNSQAGDNPVWRALALLAAQVFVIQIVFNGWLGLPVSIDLATYALLPFAILLAATGPLRYSTLASALLFITAVWATAHSSGPFAFGDPVENLYLLHVFLVISSFTALLVAGVNAERSQTVFDARRTAERYRRLAELTADWYWEQDENLRITGVTESRHFSSDDVALQVGRTRWELPHAGVSEEQKRELDRLLAERKPFRDFVMTRINANGESRIISTSGYPIFDHKSHFKGYHGIGRDITALKQGETALRESEERFRSLTDLSSDWYWEQDEQFRVAYLSPRYSASTGLAMKPTLGLTRFEANHIWESEQQKDEHRATLEAHRPFRDLRLSREDESGQMRFMSVSGEPVFDQQGRFSGYRGIGRDITGQVLADRALRSSEARFRNLTELSSDWYWEQDEELRFSFLSSTVGDATGVPADDRIGMRRWEIPGLEFDGEQLKAHQELLGQRKAFQNFVYRRVMPDGSILFVSVTGSPIFDAAGNFKGYRGVGRDVTSDVLIDQRVARLRDFYAALSKANEAIIHATDEQRLFDEICEVAVTYGHAIFARICLINADTGFLDNAAVFGDHQGYAHNTRISVRPDVMEGQGPAGIALRTGIPYVGNDIQTDDKNSFWLPAMLATGARAMVVFPLSRGGEVVGSLHLYAAERNWFGEELVALIGELVANISFALDNFERERARQRTEAALKESEERFRGLTELSNDWYWEQDVHYRNTYMSPRYSATTGMAMKSTLGETRFETDNIWESEEIKREHRKLLDARLPFRDLKLMRKDERGELHYMSISGRPVFDSGGMFTGYRGVGKDLTAQKTAENRVARLRDFYAVLSEVNNAIIHAQDRSQLFAEVCKALVEHGRLEFVRIAMLDPSNQQVRTVAHSGGDYGLLARLYFSMDPNVPEGRAPSAWALREGRHFISNNVVEDTSGILGGELLLAAGLHSVATFPLLVGGAPAGALHLCATEPGFFDDELVNLIDKLAQNVSFALNNFRREAARRGAEKALQESEQRFRDIADAAGEFVWENDSAGRFTYVSPRVIDFTGYAAEELVGRTAAEFMPGEDAQRLDQWLAENMQQDRSFRGLEHRFITKSGEVLWMQVSAVSRWDEHGKPMGHRGTTRDVTEIKKSDARISYLATRDPLTELPNRLLFNDRLEQGIIAARRKGDKLGVLFLDLDRFKNINDSLGHHIGDLLLKGVAGRMGACIRKGDTLSRLGGDEFVVTLEGLAHAEDAAQVAMKIIDALHRPIPIGDHILNTSCSIGISIYPNDAEDSRELMKNADTAMYHAKERGRNNFQFFSPEMNLRAVERHELETELRHALEAQEFVLHYQPQADIRTGKLVGIEALIRWQHPQRGLVPPNSFIPIAEESGLIELIGQWALRAACEQNQRWQLAGLPIVKIAVNISGRQFNNPKGFAEEVTRLLNATGLDPRYLELEMTEGILLKNVDENVAVLRKLGKLGTFLAVDDFGTGYSSLAYLKQLPIDTLKIDRTFVRDIETDPDDAAIIKAIIAMAHSLDLRVTAEGVETKGQLAALRKLRCDQYQGYLMSRPVPADEFALRFLASPVSAARKSASL